MVSHINGWVFIQSWRWDPPKLSRKTPSFSQNDFGKFLRGGYPNRSSGIHRWGLDLSTGYRNIYFSSFSGYPQLTLVFSAGRRKVSDIFLRCLSRKSGSQHQLRIKTLPSHISAKSVTVLRLGLRTLTATEPPPQPTRLTPNQTPHKSSGA